MGNRASKNKKINGQSTLEMTIALILVIVFIGGIVKMWLWSNSQIVKRQMAYNASRLAAGQATDNYTLQWPVYTPENLTEDDVLIDSPLTNFTKQDEG